jgi:hypothetical protein
MYPRNQYEHYKIDSKERQEKARRQNYPHREHEKSQSHSRRRQG